VNPSPVSDAGAASPVICEGQQVQLQSSGGISYKWWPVAGLSSAVIADPLAMPADTTLYSVVVANQFACTDTSTVLVNVVSRPVVNAGPDKTIIRGDTVRLEGSMGGQDVDFIWWPLNTSGSLQPLVSPPLGTDYVLTGVSRLGCGIVTDTVHVFVYEDIFVPNAFTPNGDGVNDLWRVPALSALKVFDVRVYNRYGQMVFQTRDVNRGWDGRNQPAGVYVYFITVDGGRRMFRGTITMVR
jgi:gliding motility-associated-like protein